MFTRATFALAFALATGPGALAKTPSIAPSHVARSVYNPTSACARCIHGVAASPRTRMSSVPVGAGY